MKIAPEILSEKNYTGSRLIPIKSKVVMDLKKQLNEFQKKANPTLLKMEKLSKILDPFYVAIGSHQQEINRIKESAEFMKAKADYDIELKKVELIDQKAQLVKNKMQPLVLDEVKSQLGEFEKALHINDKNGMLFVEVMDELEEKIKQIRAAKTK